MGYDVFLSWDGMTEEEKTLQKKGWDINRGNVGYLRAATWMRAEIRFLGSIFPREYWLESREGNANPLPYDFESNMLEMKKVAAEYLESAGANHAIGALHAHAREPNSKNNPQGPGLGSRTSSTDGLVGSDAEVWVRAVNDFFSLGVQKQKEERNPKVAVA